MTVSAIPNFKVYAGSGSTGPFSFTFTFDEDSELSVVKTDISGTQTVLTLNVDYTVIGAGTLSGGSVTLLSALPTGYALTVTRKLPIIQDLSLPTGGPFYASDIEKAFDRTIKICQQLYTLATEAGAVTFPDGAGITGIVKGNGTSVFQAATAGVDYVAPVDDAIATNMIQNNAVTENKILNSAVTEDKIANSAVTNNKIAPATILRAKFGTDVYDKLVQIVEATPYNTYASISAVIPIDNTIPQNTEGAEIITVSITPKYANSRLRINAIVECIYSGAENVCMALFQDTTANALATAMFFSSGSIINALPLAYEMESGTTSLTTFKIRIGTGSAAIYINGNGSNRLFGGTLAVRLSVTEVIP